VWDIAFGPALARDIVSVDELSNVIVGRDETETVLVLSALRDLLLLADLLHIVSTKPRIITKNTCHSFSFHIISSLSRLKKLTSTHINLFWQLITSYKK